MDPVGQLLGLVPGRAEELSRPGWAGPGPGLRLKGLSRDTQLISEVGGIGATWLISEAKLFKVN